MTASEYLSEIERLRVRIGTIKAELEATYESINLLPGVSYDGVNVQVSTTDSKVLEVVEQCVDKTRKLAEAIEKYEAAKSERIAKIHELTDPQQVEVLCARYITGMYWWEVAREMHMSERWVYKLHAAALGELDKAI